MRVLYHPKVGALFVDRFSKGARALTERNTGGLNWRAWFFGRFRIMVVKATEHWATR